MYILAYGLYLMVCFLLIGYLLTGYLLIYCLYSLVFIPLSLFLCLPLLQIAWLIGIHIAVFKVFTRHAPDETIV